MVTIEIIAAVTTLICVILLRYKNFLGWPVGIIAAICYGILFLDVKLYGQFSIQIIFILQSIWGWWIWKDRVDETNKIRSVRSLFVFEVMLIMFVF